MIRVVFKQIKDKIKNSGVGDKAEYGKTWQEKSGSEQIEWYEKMHNSCLKMHDDFKKFLAEKSPTAVLEVGCGAGYYPIKLKELFRDMEYTGIDISETAIKACKSKSTFDFICTDFLKKGINKKFDLVFSHALIDHVYDVDLFIEKIIASSNRFVYVTAYRGYFPDLKKHVMRRNDADGSYYNDVSTKQLTKKLLGVGLQEQEFSFNSIKVADEGKDDDWQTIIKIEKR